MLTFEKICVFICSQVSFPISFKLNNIKKKKRENEKERKRKHNKGRGVSIEDLIVYFK